ncbi:MAG TPA: hypothetical protein VK578_00150 [Edaphobacter sp.]|nr:hypothetical protein [Edaphobacter sp.]
MGDALRIGGPLGLRQNQLNLWAKNPRKKPTKAPTLALTTEAKDFENTSSLWRSQKDGDSAFVVKKMRLSTEQEKSTNAKNNKKQGAERMRILIR